MGKIRNKVVCEEIHDDPGYKEKVILFSAVDSINQDDKSRPKHIRHGCISIVVGYENEVFNFFEKGKQYYVDFTPAE